MSSIPGGGPGRHFTFAESASLVRAGQAAQAARAVSFSEHPIPFPLS
jgi:hypothetical protein